MTLIPSQNNFFLHHLGKSVVKAMNVAKYTIIRNPLDLIYQVYHDQCLEV
jgi:hypothetical protein